jgi:hypothetical protein
MTQLDLQTPDEILAHRPMVALEEISTFSFSKEDTLVVCAGFEERALAILQKTTPCCNIVIIKYLPPMENNLEHEISNTIKNASSIQKLIYDRENPSGFDEMLLAEIRKHKDRIFIDISAMSRLLIVQIIVALKNLKHDFGRVVILYTEAKDYYPSKEQSDEVIEKNRVDPQFTAHFLASGVNEITIIPELSTVTSKPLQTRLIFFPSFDVQLLIALRFELQPTAFTYIEGRPPKKELEWRTEAIARLNHLDDDNYSERLSPTSTLDYRETLRCLLDIYQRPKSLKERLLIAPTGSKMQTVAVGIFRSFVTDVQIVYPTPIGFRDPKNYSRGIGATYQLALSSFVIPSRQ